jgi:CRP-like cAMP-binding protein
MTIDAGQYNIDKIIRESPWFSHLPQKALQKLAVSAQIKRYATSDYLYRVGEKKSSVYCLLFGHLGISVSSHLGKEFALTDLDPQYWLGEVALTGDQARIQEAQLQTDADILLIPRSIMLTTGEEFLLLYHNLFYENLLRFRKILELMAGIAFYPLRARLAGSTKAQLWRALRLRGSVGCALKSK